VAELGSNDSNAVQTELDTRLAARMHAFDL
jgi:hypothetical protein